MQSGGRPEAESDESGDRNNRSLRVYTRRFWLLGVFCMLAVLQSASWNFYSPISGVVEGIYGWSGYEVEWMANVAGLVFTVTVSIWSGVIDTHGVRLCVVLSGGFLLLCSGLRAIPGSSSTHTALVFASMVFNGLSGAIIGLAPPLISANWFPPNERTTSTALATMANYLGQGVGFLWGPAYIPSYTYYDSDGNEQEGPTDGSKQALHKLYWMQTALCAACFVSLLAYYPSRAPTPPSRSAQVQKTEFTTGFRQLLRNRQFWWLVVSFGMPVGWFSGWMATLDLNLSNLNVDESNASYIGAAQILAGCLSGLAAGQISDRFGRRYMRWTVVSFYLTSTAAFLWFTLMASKIIPWSLPALYASSVIGGLGLNGSIPLFYEMCVETVFPIAEGSASGFLVLFQNLIQSIFLIVPINSMGTAWMNWSLLAIIPIFAVAMMLFEENYQRERIDNDSNDESKAMTGEDSMLHKSLVS